MNPPETLPKFVVLEDSRWKAYLDVDGERRSRRLVGVGRTPEDAVADLNQRLAGIQIEIDEMLQPE